jgi:hypothetical protein
MANLDQTQKAGSLSLKFRHWDKVTSSFAAERYCITFYIPLTKWRIVINHHTNLRMKKTCKAH